MDFVFVVVTPFYVGAKFSRNGFYSIFDVGHVVTIESRK
jgi:hypothetical protein